MGSLVYSHASEGVAADPAPATKEPDGRGNAERAEKALRAAATGATLMWECIRDIAIAIRSGGAGAGLDARALLLLAGPGGVAKLMMAAGAATNMAIGGFRQLIVLRAEEAAAMPGTQTLYPLGEGRHAQIPQAEGNYLRSSIEALDEELRQIKAGKYAPARCAECRASEVRDTSQHPLTRTSETNEH